jgi:hypothetical protein
MPAELAHLPADLYEAPVDEVRAGLRGSRRISAFGSLVAAGGVGFALVLERSSDKTRT